MKTLILGTCIFFCLVYNDLSAQPDAPFTNLNMSEVNTGIFYPQSKATVVPPNAADYTEKTIEETKRLFAQFDWGFLDDNAMPEISELQQDLIGVKREYNAIPLTILDFNYNAFKANTITSALIFQVDGNWYDTPNRQESPYETRTTLVLDVDMEKYTDEILHFPNGAGLSGAGLTECSQCLIL